MLLLLLTFLLAVRLCGAATVVPECTTESSSAVRSLSAGLLLRTWVWIETGALRCNITRNLAIIIIRKKIPTTTTTTTIIIITTTTTTTPTHTISKDLGDQDSLQDRKGVSSAVFSAQMMVKSDENQETNGTPEDHDHDQINRNIPHNHSEDSVEVRAVITRISNKHVVHVHVDHGNQNASEQEDQPGGEIVKNVAIAWVGGFLSITVISLLSLLGVILIPLMNKVFFKFLLSFLVALAVGTLSGDAFLHLIPHSQGGHHHQHEDSGMNDSGHDHHEEENLDGVWKGLTALSGVQKKWDQNDKADPEKQPALEDLKPAEEESVDYTAEDCENKCHSHFHDTVGNADRQHHHHHDYHHILHHHHSQNHHPTPTRTPTPEQHFQQAGVAALAWMVIMGDGLHNFSDGLAIGDFAVLLKAGMTVRQAILYNGLSALMAYLGVVIGILIGHYAENVSMWVFALTAGLFLYVALMLHNDAGDHGFSHCGFFLLQNAGILLGFCIMLLIA
ncbi:hypothetical protein F7725_010905, partial [Dissostichus mawsoni]